MRKITPSNNNGSIRLQFTYAGTRYTFNPIPGADFNNSRDYKTVLSIATQIENDILAKNFDTTLDRYRLVEKSIPKVVVLKSLVELWDIWVDSLNLPPATKEHHYKAIRNHILKTNPSCTNTSWLTGSSLGASTFNQRLGYLKMCFKWAIANGLIRENPYEALKPRKVNSKSVKPFSNQEIIAIVKGFEEHYPHYAPFVKFLFATGVRTSEAIGLRWGNIDFDRNIITIQESLSRDWTGNGYQRIRKSTKTGEYHCLSLSDDLKRLLLPLKRSDPNELVFTTVSGKTIDDGNFRERYWVKALAKVGVEYRNLYTTRHTTASHAIDQGMPVTKVAYMLGHKDSRMVVHTYGHLLNRPELPDMPIG